MSMGRSTVLLVIILVMVPTFTMQRVDGQLDSIKHVIVLMQENRTFDHYFGTYPGANGIPEGTSLAVTMTCEPEDSTCKPDLTTCVPADGTLYVEPFHLSTRRTPDPPHDETTARLGYNHGRMDCLVFAQNLKGFNGTLTMGYYDYRDIPYYWNLAEYYVLADNFFSSAMGGSFPNHVYLYAGTDNNSTGYEYRSIPPEGMNLTTIFDRLESQGVSWKNYVQNYNASVTYKSELDRLGLGPKSAQLIWAPLLGITRFVENQTLNSKIQDLNQFFADVNSDDFPSVVYISPSGQSEHAPSDIARGQLFAVNLITALMTSKHWSDSVFILTYDDYGGWYDHVPPPQQQDGDGYGYRVPALIISPYARDGAVDNTEYDFTSILALIETRFNLQPLVANGRDSKANNLLEAFDFSSIPRPPVIPQGDYPQKAPKVQRSPFIVWISYAGILTLVTALPLAVVFLRTRRKDHYQERAPSTNSKDSESSITLFEAMCKGLRE